MIKSSLFLRGATLRALSLSFTFGLAACGGGSSGNSSPAAASDTGFVAAPSSGTVAAPTPGSAGATAADSATSAAANAAASTTAGGNTTGNNAAEGKSNAMAAVAVTTITAPPPATLPLLALPATIVDGSVVQLECGRTYAGTLNLSGKSNVTVRTAGDCGKATLTPGQAVTGWTRHQGNIYSAPIGFDAAQVLIDSQPLARAHWPSRAQTWTKAASTSSSSLSYAMPSGDLVGATLLFRPNDWAIEARRITAYSGNTMTLATTGNISFDGYGLSGQPDFYVEGKLWMLDEPGEWAVEGGRLYVWAADGQSPEGRAFASPDKDGIDARNSKNIALENLRIYGAANGVNALDASKLRLTAVDIVNSSGNGVLNSGGTGLVVDTATIRNTRHDAIAVKWGGGGEIIRNSTIDASGAIGMPTNVHAAINLTVGVGSQVLGNTVTNSGYIGIRVFRNALVSQNRIDTACLVLTDCGGIYVMAPDQQPLDTLIDGNTIANVGGTQRLAWAIDIDDSANAVTVSNNTVTGSANGMQIHNGFNNIVSGNRFSASHQAHIQMDEDGAAILRNNVVKGNVFTSTNGEETYRISSTLGSSSVAQFATYDGNDYTSSSPIFANFNGEPLSYAQWKARTGQDGTSVFKAP